MRRHNQMPVQAQPEAAALAIHRNLTLRAATFCGLTVCSFVITDPAPAQSAEVLPAKVSASQPAQGHDPSAEPQGHQLQRYQAFARQTELPAITVISNMTLQVGSEVKTDIVRLAQLTSGAAEALAARFGVPTAVIARLAQRAANSPPPSTAQIAQELRTAVIDYRFLRGEWDRYHPPAEGQQTKVNALEALQAGDLAKAWSLYDGLAKPAAPAVARPAPPTNLRVVAGH